MGIAGRFDWDAACQLIGSQFEDWTPKHRPQIVEVPRTKFVRHIPFDSTQTHIGLACPAPNFRSPEFLLIQGAVSALSGGVSSRLFTEVREKRGLCYTVSASLISKGCRGALFCYCGTSSERAQESLDVILLELRRLTDEGVTEDELAKMKIRLKSGLVLQQESSGSRCHSIVSDWHRFGRIRSMAELEQRIDDLTREQINTYLKAHPFGPFRMVTLGPGPLSIAPELVG